MCRSSPQYEISVPDGRFVQGSRARMFDAAPGTRQNEVVGSSS